MSDSVADASASEAKQLQSLDDSLSEISVLDPRLAALEKQLGTLNDSLNTVNAELELILVPDPSAAAADALSEEESEDLLKQHNEKKKRLENRMEILKSLIQARKAKARVEADARSISLSAGLHSAASAAAASTLPPAAATSSAAAPQEKQVSIPSNMPVWDPTKFSTVREFLRQLDVTLSAANIPRSHWPAMLRYSCRDNKHNDDWITKTIIKPNRSWDDALKLFEERFKERDLSEVLRREYKDIEQGPNESVLDFANRFQSIAAQLGYNDDDKHVVDHFSDCLRSDAYARVKDFFQRERRAATLKKDHAYLLALDSQEKSLSDFAELAIQLEADERTIKAAGHNQQQPRKQERKRDSGSNNQGSGWQTQPKRCKKHPKSTTHSWDECRENPKNASSSTQKNSSKTASAAGSSTGSKPIVCYKCKANGHKANDPACPYYKRAPPREAAADSSAAKDANRSSTSSSSGQQTPKSGPPGGSSTTTVATRRVDFIYGTSDGMIDRSLPVDILNGDIAAMFDSALFSKEASSTKATAAAVTAQDAEIFNNAQRMTADVASDNAVSLRRADMRALVTVVFNGVKHLAGLDTYASHSIIDKAFVERNNISFVPAAGTVELADAALVAQRIGFVNPPISVSIQPPGVTLQHAFEVLNLRASTYQYDFLIGRDLQDRFFRQGNQLILPLLPFSDTPSHASNGAPPSPVREATPNDSDFIEMEIDSTFVPEEGLPERLRLSTPEALAAEYEARRKRVLSAISEELGKNARIAGFCSLPESRVTLRLKPGAEGHLNQRQYPLARSLVEKARPKVEKWKLKGRIEPAPPGCRFNNPLTIQPKKDDQGVWSGIEVRVCFDGRRLNQWMETDDKFPIPRIQDILESLAGCPIYGQFDLEDCYLQFELAPESREYTAFTFDGEQYVFCGSIYGIKPLAGHLQRLISRLLRDVKRCLPYFDNIPFGSHSWSQHAEQALLILRRLNAANLKVKPSSVQIGHAVMNVLGHTLSASGVGIADDKLDCIMTWEPPRTGKDMASFLGFVLFISQHVRHFGELTAPFHDLKALKTKSIDWTPELLERFETLKKAVKNSPDLTPPDYSRPFYVATDASNSGIGGVLYQPAPPDDDITPFNIVSIFSKKLNATQVRYAAYKKELFALVSCLRKFHSHIWGRTDTVVITDHKPLTYIFSQPEPSPAMRQWLDVLLDYKLEIRHRAGILHVAPDALSRMYSAAYASSPRWGVASSQSIASVAGAPPPDFSYQFPDSRPSAVLSVRAFTRRAARDERQRARSAAAAAAPQPSSASAAMLQASLSQPPVFSPAAVFPAGVSPAGGGALVVPPAASQPSQPPPAAPPPPQRQVQFAVDLEAKYDTEEEKEESERRRARMQAASNAQALPNASVVPDAPSNASNSSVESKPPIAFLDPNSPENRDALLVAMELRGMQVPEQRSDRIKLIKARHDLGHFGREAMYKKLVAEGIWWPLMRKDIEQELRSCDDCLKNTIVKRGFHPAQFVHSLIPWDHIQIDTATNLPESIDGKTVFLVVIDACTGFVILRALPDKEMATVAKELWSIFALLGLPRVIQSDNGTEFVNQLIEALVKLTGIDHRTIAEYNPRADGKVEHAVGTAKTVIMKRLHGHERLWTLYVDYTQLSINLKIAELTNTSPFALMLGRQCNPIRDYSQDPPLDVDMQAWTDHQERIASLILPAINERVSKLKEGQSAHLNKIRRQLAPESLPAGATVMVRNVYKTRKFDPVYLGPYTIERRSRSGTYVLRDAVGDILDRRIPADQIKLISRVPMPRDSEKPIFEVNRIVSHRGEPGQFEYLIDWKGYDASEQSWEPEENILNPNAIAAYWHRLQREGLPAGQQAPIRSARANRRQH